jgi:hypothetical protein
VTPALLVRLGRSEQGTTLTEFAVLAPTLLLFIMGAMDLSQRAYAQSVLEGAMQKAGRDSGIQGGAETTHEIDKKVQDMVRKVFKQATFTSTRKSYSTFSNIKPERFADNNNNGARDAGECFDDVNGNKSWDVDPGISGQGGADDITVYRMEVSYPRILPMYGLLKWPKNQVISAKTILRNQPYASQTVIPVQSICT